MTESNEGTVADEPSGDQLPETAPTSRDAAQHEREEPPYEQSKPVTEHEDPLAQIRRLELELERYREHAQRTSQLFLSATKYAEWVRENARRDAELALRKARARADKIEALTHEREETEQEVARLRAELARLEALTEATRTRLSSFLTAGLKALNRDAEVGHDEGPEPAGGDLQDALQERLGSTSVAEPVSEPAQPEH